VADDSQKPQETQEEKTSPINSPIFKVNGNQEEAAVSQEEAPAATSKEEAPVATEVSHEEAPVTATVPAADSSELRDGRIVTQ
jgi:hypothetical protein